jgi:hypothetical protein
MALQADFGPEPDTVAHIIRSGAKVIEVPVEMSERIAGNSYLNPTRAMRYMFNILVSILIFQWFRPQIRLGV